MEITRTVKNEPELWATLRRLSVRYGGAWVHSVKPFSHEATFKRFRNPSSVPDHWLDLSGNKLAWKGKIRPFTRAARAREQSRGYGRR